MIDLIKFTIFCVTVIVCFGFACEYSYRKYQMKYNKKDKKEDDNK